MSKSKKNVVDLDAFVTDFGADVARWFVLSDSPPERDVEWTAAGVEGAWGFVQRVWSLVDAHGQPAPKPNDAAPPGADTGEPLALRQLAHRTIRVVTDDIEHFRFNVAVARGYELVNAIAKLKGDDAALRVRARRGAAHPRPAHLPFHAAPRRRVLGEARRRGLRRHRALARRRPASWPRATP